MTSELPATPCPWCGYVLDAASYAGGGDVDPVPGDLSVCMSCASVLRFGPDLILEACPEAELKALPEKRYQRLRLVQRVIRKLDRRKLSG